MDNANFVKKCGELLKIAKPNLISCEYKLGKDIELTSLERLYKQVYLDEDEYVVVNCENGCRYVLLISGNSLNAIAQEIFNSMAGK